MNRRIWLALAALLLVVGCRAIAGYRDLTYGLQGDAGCAPIVLPTSGEGRIRLANVGTRGAAADFCMRVNGTADWGSPVFSGSGAACARGLAYATATIPFAVPAGRIDVEAVPVGSSCSAMPTSVASSVAVGDVTQGGPVVTLVRMGGEAIPERIVALPEEASAGGDSVRLRFVNAIDGSQGIVVGPASSVSLPATVPLSDIPLPIAPGDVEPPSAAAPIGVIDAAGYATVIGAIAIGVSFAGETSALFVFAAPSQTDTRTIFALGNADDSAHTLRGLSCDESGATADAGAGSSASILQSCVLSDLPSIEVDVAEVALYGANAPFEDARRQPIYDAIAGRTSDLVCVTDVNRQSDKTGVAAAAAKSFPYSFFPDPPSDLDTQPSDSTEIDGGAPPPPPTSPPCAGVGQSDIDGFYSCLATNCSTTGDMSGSVSTTKCAESECTIPGTNLYKRGPQQNVCWDCIIYYMISEPLSQGEMACTQDSRQPFSFDGQTSSMILSRYPLVEEKAFILPGSGFRKALLYAGVQLEDQTIDFYCADLVSSAIDTELPYTGNYGQDAVSALPDGGELVENGWQDEKDNQAKKVIAFIQANSALTKRRAIISGFWEASTLATAPDGGVLVTDLSPEIPAWLGAAFVRGEPSGYFAACDTCPAPTNVYNGAQLPEQLEGTYLLGFDNDSIDDDFLWGNGDVVPLPTALPYQSPPAANGPISNVFPRSVRILRPRAP